MAPVGRKLSPGEIAKAQGHGLFRYYAALQLPVAFHLNVTQTGFIKIEREKKLAETNPDIHAWLLENDMTCGVERAAVEEEQRAYRDREMAKLTGHSKTSAWYVAEAQMYSDPTVRSDTILRFASDAHLLLFRFRWM